MSGATSTREAFANAAVDADLLSQERLQRIGRVQAGSAAAVSHIGETLQSIQAENLRFQAEMRAIRAPSQSRTTAISPMSPTSPPGTPVPFGTLEAAFE